MTKFQLSRSKFMKVNKICTFINLYSSKYLFILYICICIKIYILGDIDYYKWKEYTSSKNMVFAKWLINLCTNRIGCELLLRLWLHGIKECVSGLNAFPAALTTFRNVWHSVFLLSILHPSDNKVKTFVEL